LIERVVRNDEVVGLIPICSTKFPLETGGKFPSISLAKEGATASPVHATGLRPRRLAAEADLSCYGPENSDISSSLAPYLLFHADGTK
jgi:hypothetical protein